MRKQGDPCKTQTRQRCPAVLGCCRRPQLQVSCWEGKETFLEGGVETCCPGSICWWDKL